MTVPDSVDVVIVGSGPAGSAFARVIRRLRPETTIVMLERGPAITPQTGINVRNLPAPDRARVFDTIANAEVQQLDDFVGAEGEPIVRARPGTHVVAMKPQGSDDQSGMPGALVAENVGGMGVFWTCATPRPRDGERISFIAPAELDDAFDEAERLLQVGTDGYPVTDEGDRLLGLLAAEFDGDGPHGGVARMPLAGRPSDTLRHPVWSGSGTVLGELAEQTDGDDFWLVPDCAATRILTDGDRATGVRARHRSGEESVIQARVVVVAADTLRTPQLLWASGIRPEALGRYLNDQPQVVAAAYLRPDPGSTADDAAEATDGTAFDDGDDHPFHGTPDGGQESVTGVLWVPYDEAAGRPFHGQIMQMDASPIAIGDGSVRDPRPVVGIGYFAAKELSPHDRVRFDESCPDEFGLPAIRIDYELTVGDRAMLERAVALAARTAEAIGEYVPGGEPVILPAGSSIHYQGTVRMGESDDGRSVCDSRSRVWGTSNLFVGGNGVIPTPTGCNPTLTNVALAVRAAAGVVETLRDGR